MELMHIKKVMVVDDSPANLEFLEALLEKNGHKVFSFPRSELAIRALERINPDLILLDIMMPGMNGFEFCHKIKQTENWRHIPVIFMSGLDNLKDKMRAFKEGGADYVTKPFYPEEVLARVSTHINQKKLLENLEELVEEKTQGILILNKQLLETQKEIVSKLGDVIETRSQETGYHVRRVAYVSKILALEYGLPPEEAEIIRMASPLHDVGKIGIPDCILNKCGKLTEEEFEQIKAHTGIGYSILSGTEQPIIQAGAIIALQHHERWDGNGYPYGLKGEEIHIYGRITCLADIYDALRLERPYKRAWSRQEVSEYIQEHSGKIFDPVLAGILMSNTERIEKIIEEYNG